MFLICVAATASAQVENTAYGKRYKNNRNLRMVDSTKVHTELNVGGHYTFGDVEAYGVDVSASRVYTPSNAFAWEFGAQISSEYNENFGAMTDILGQVGVRFGKSFGVEVKGLAGAGQMSYKDISAKDEKNHAEYYNSSWRPVAGGEVALFAAFSEKVSLRVFGRATHYFNSRSDRSYEEAQGWQHEPTEFNLNKVAVGATLTVKVGGNHQISGDNNWNGGVYTGYSFGKNKGFVAGAELFHTKRTSATFARVLGVGSQQTFGEETSFNEIYGKVGGQILPKGANSPVVFEFGAKLGLGEYNKAEQAATQNNSYSMNSSVQVPGVVAKAYAGINLHWGANSLKFGVEGGGHAAFGTSFNSNTSNYVGATHKKTGFDAVVTVGYVRSF